MLIFTPHVHAFHQAWHYGVGYAGYMGYMIYRMYQNDNIYDIDSVNRHWENMHREQQNRPSLPSSYVIQSADDLRYHIPAEGSLARAAPSANLSPLVLDVATTEWVDEVTRSPRGLLHSIQIKALQMVGYEPFEAQAVLDCPRVHQMSTAQWQEVLKEHEGCNNALDIGAASGHITLAFSSLFQSVYAVEISGRSSHPLSNQQREAGHNLALD